MEDTNLRTKIEAYGIKGFDGMKWRKIFNNEKELNKWIEKNNAEVEGTREIEES